MTRRTIFLSHSSKDIERVRKIRDILEALEYEPLLFYLKCLDDNNEQLEEFIKKEIEARNIFIYCRSRNSERSPWVQKELEYINKFNSKRLFTIDIEQPLQNTLVCLLESIANILKKNRIFLSCAHGEPDFTFGNSLEVTLNKYGYEVFRYKKISNDLEYEQALHNSIKEGVVVPVISHHSLYSYYCKKELETALYYYENNYSSGTIVPIYYGIKKNIAQALLPTSLANIEGIEIGSNEEFSQDELNFFLEKLKGSS